MVKLFVLGDSISIQYGPYLKNLINKRFIYDRKRGETEALQDLNNPIGANGGDINMVLAYLKEQEANGELNYDILLLNCGLHDIKTDPATGKKQVSIADYESNLNLICQLIKNKDIKIIWVRTTPVLDERHNSINKDFMRFNQDVLKYNDIADSIMTNHNIPIIDLYTLVKNLGDDVYCDHVHFTEEVRLVQAAYIAGFLSSF